MPPDDTAPKLFEDREHKGDWRVEYQDDDGGCYVAVFSGRLAHQRARAYYGAHQSHVAGYPTLRAQNGRVLVRGIAGTAP
jgi:hypothetical protein